MFCAAHAAKAFQQRAARAPGVPESQTTEPAV
jgi:hypothetical protein